MSSLQAYLTPPSGATHDQPMVDSDALAPSREMRSSPRRSAQVRVRISEPDMVRYTLLADIGMGGARLVTAAPPAIGQKLGLRFRLRAEGPDVSAEAVVVWRSEGLRGRGGLVGVEFASVSDLGEIIAFLRQS